MKKSLRKLCLILAGVLLLSAAFSGCSGGESNAPAANGSDQEGETEGNAEQTGGEKTVTYALQAGWDSLVPFYWSSSGYYGTLVWDKLYDKLVTMRSDGSYTARGAKSWTMSEDKMTLTFELDETAKWHDGQPVTAQDWEFTAQLLSDPDFAAPDCSKFCMLIAGTDDTGKETSENSIGIKATGDYTLEINFKNPTSIDSFFTTYSIYYSVLPQHLLGDIPAGEVLENDFWKAPVGSGPCKFVSELTNSEIVFEPFADYHLGAPQFDKLVMKVLSSSNFASALMTGEIDYCYPPMSIEESKALESADGLSVVRAEYPTNLWFMSINHEQYPDVRIRKALNLAVDKELIAQQLFQGEAVAVESVLVPGGYQYNNDLKGGRDIEEAKRLLDEAGWDYNQTITIATPAGVREQIATIMQQNFAEIGLKAEVVTLDIGTMFGGLNDGTYAFGMVGGNACFDPLYMNNNFDPRSTTFFKITENTYMDAANAIIMATDDDAKLQAIMDYQQLMYDEQTLVPIVTQYSYSIHTTRLQDIDAFATARGNDMVWEWTITE